MRRLALLLLTLCLFTGPARADPLRIATFEADVTPPIGTPLCDALVQPAKQIDDPLFARGIILLPDGPPIVLEHTTCGHEADVYLACRHCGAEISEKTVTAHPGGSRSGSA